MTKDAREPQRLPAVLRRWKQAVDEQRGEPQPLPAVLRGWQAARDAEREAWARDEAWAIALPQLVALCRRADGDVPWEEIAAELQEILSALPPRRRPATAGEIALVREVWAEVEAAKAAGR